MEKNELYELFCPLCQNKYDDAINLPRMLPECGHTFCSHCLKTLLNQNDNGLICPEDKYLVDFFMNFI